MQPAVGQRIREQRVLNAWSQEELAAISGLTGESISRIESGKQLPHPRNLRKIADAFSLPVQFFTRPQDDREL